MSRFGECGGDVAQGVSAIGRGFNFFGSLQSVGKKPRFGECGGNVAQGVSAIVRVFNFFGGLQSVGKNPALANAEAMSRKA